MLTVGMSVTVGISVVSLQVMGYPGTPPGDVVRKLLVGRTGLVYSPARCLVIENVLILDTQDTTSTVGYAATTYQCAPSAGWRNCTEDHEGLSVH